MSRESSSLAPAEEVVAGYWAAEEEAAARLEAMDAIGHGEDDLSEEQLQANEQLQQDELLALQAIYGVDLDIFENKAGLRFFQISVHYQLTDDIHVHLDLCPHGTVETRIDNDDDCDDGEFLYACCLQHLPPVVLTCLLPQSYPSTYAPYFRIVVKKLDEQVVSNFCIALDEIWTELPGQEVVYRWVDWAK